MSTKEAFARLAEEVELQNDGPAIARVRRIQLALFPEVEALRHMPEALMALEPECRKVGEEVLDDLKPLKPEHLKQAFREKVRSVREAAHNLINLPRMRAADIKRNIEYVDNLTIPQSKKYMEVEVIRVLREDLRPLTSTLEVVRKAPAGVLAMRDALLREMESASRLTDATEALRMGAI